MLQGNEIYQDLVGQPFNKDTMNCYTLCQIIAKRVGKILPDQEFIHSAIIRSKTFEEGCEEFGIKLDGPEPLCMVVFRGRGPLAGHMGIVLPNCYKFIHVRSGIPVTIERLDSPLWEKSIAGYFRYKD